MSASADRLLTTLLHHPRVGRVLAANPYRSAPVRAVRRRTRPEPPLPNGGGRHHLVEPLRVGRRHPTSVSKVARLYDRYERRLQKAAGRLRMTRPAVITCNPFVAAHCSFDWAGPVTFYAFDDWAAYPPHRQWWPAYESAYARIAERGRRVCAVSQTIVDRIAPTGPWVVMPNGLAPEEWHEPWAVPPWFEALSAPRLLYLGTLDSRLDPAALLETAGAFEHGSVVLVGTVTEPAAVEPLHRAANLHIRPPVGRQEVAGLVHRAEACLLPHRRTSLTSAMSPLKLYEYLAGGSPVAASDLAPVRAVDERVVIVPESASFAEGVARALALGPAPEPQRLEFVRSNSWSVRHEMILDLALRR